MPNLPGIWSERVRVEIFLEIMGITAMSLILFGYFLISTNKVDAKSVKYHILNVIGSLIFVVYLSIKSAWSAVGLNVAWAVIGIIALFAIFRKKKKDDFGNKNEES